MGLSVAIVSVLSFFALDYINGDAKSFLQIWGLVQLFSCCVNFNHVTQFYKWWVNSRMTEKNRTGLSTYGYPFLGFIPIPRLSSHAYVGICLLYIGSLAALILFPTRLYIGISFILALPYYGCNWAELSMSYHREALTITLYMYFLLCNTFDTAVFCLRVHLTSLYMSSVFQKLLYSVVEGKLWFRWSVHGFMWKSMWSKPIFFQQWLFVHPNICAFMGFISMLVESIFIVNIIQPEYSTLVFLSIVGFHLGVFLVQDIDYLNYWVPVLLVLGCKINTNIYTVHFDFWGDMGFCMLAFQLFYALTMQENWNINIPPFISCPMFVLLVLMINILNTIQYLHTNALI